jgi:hypothetical protein
MAPAVSSALKSLDEAIRLPKFNPSSSNKKFTIAANEFATTVVVPRLLRILRSEAPFIDIAIKSATRIDLAEQIDLGKLDAAIGSFSTVPSRFKSGILFEYDDVVVMHSTRAIGDITTDVLSKLSIVVISSEGQQEKRLKDISRSEGLRNYRRCTTDSLSIAHSRQRPTPHEFQFLCHIFLPFRLSCVSPSSWQSFQGRSRTPLRDSGRSAFTNCLMLRRRPKLARYGMNEITVTHRKSGFATPLDGHPNICALVRSSNLCTCRRVSRAFRMSITPS